MICQQAPGEWRILKIHKGNLYFRLTPDWQLLFMSFRQFPWLGLLETWNIYVQLFCLTVSKCDVLNLFIFMINFMSYLLWDVFCLFNFDFIDIPKNIHKRFSPQHLTCDMSKETETIFWTCWVELLSHIHKNHDSHCVVTLILPANGPSRGTSHQIRKMD